MADFEFSVA